MKRHKHKWKWFEGYAGAEINWCEKCGMLMRHWARGKPEIYKPLSLVNTTPNQE